jgi:formylglycine-generating enzyme required for sulfatase activity
MSACGRLGFDAVVAGDARGDAIGDGGTLVLSCASLAPTCGPAGTSPCCASSVVSGGTFYRGFDVGTDGMFPIMANSATLSDFRLDTYEVTVGRFRQFVNAGMGTQATAPPPGAGARALNGMANQGGWDPTWNASLVANTAALIAGLSCDAQYQSWTDTPGANESLPINCITWFEAMAFCVWDGGFLPTDAEWNYAAVGGAAQRAFPWSSPASAVAIDCSDANYSTGTTTCVNPPNGGVNPVGSESPQGDGAWGQADLAGNLYEWNLDYDSGSPINPCNDCANLVASAMRRVRGGYFFNLPALVRGATYSSDTPASRTNSTGVCCARAP